jgi:hypothetical protein
MLNENRHVGSSLDDFLTGYEMTPEPSLLKKR